MKHLKQTILALFMIWMGCQWSMAATYSTLNGYRVFCDEQTISSGSEVEVPLYLTNRTILKPAFQVDIYLPAGVTPVSVSGGDGLAAPVADCSIISTWDNSRRTLRLVVTGNSNWGVNSKLQFARIRLMGGSGLQNGSTIDFENFIFTQESDNNGYFGTTANVQIITAIMVNSVTVTPSQVTMYMGDELTLNAEVLPSNATDKSLTWTSSNSSVASVSTNLKVYANGVGTATITARTNDGSNITGTCVVTVLPPRATSITLSQDELEVGIGDNAQLSATVLPANANQQVSWCSSKPGVATIDSEGMIHGVSEGVSIVTATTTDGSHLTAVCLVTVKPVLATAISLNKSAATLAKNETLQLNATVTPSNTTNKGVTWTSNNPEVARVNANGLVTALKAGTATISATTTDGTALSAACDIDVIDAWVNQIVLDKTNIDVYLDGTDTIHATVLPDNATQAVIWSSSDPNTASVDENGVVTALNVGSAVITATAGDGSGVTATCLVNVPDADGNYLSAESFSIVRGNEVYVPIAMTNSKLVSAVQCELRLTGGLEVAQDEYGDHDIYLSNRATNHELVSTQRQDFMQILAASITNDPFKSNMGTLFFIHLIADKNLEEGTYMMALRNITLSTSDGERIHTPDVEVTIGIEPYMRGDANGDNHVDVADFVTATNYILFKDPFPFFFRAADVDINGSVDANDLTGITNIGLGKSQATPAVQNGPSMTRTAALDASSSLSDNTAMVSLSLENTMELSALQMDMLLPEGVTVDDIVLTSRATDEHEVAWNLTPQGLVRVLICSQSNAALRGVSGDLLEITLRGNIGVGQVAKIMNIIASEPASVRHELPDLQLTFGTTGVSDLNVYTDVRIYAEDGTIIIESPYEGTAQFIQTNGMTTPLKVVAGRNVYPMGIHGIAIVRLNDYVEKVKF